MIEVAYRKPRNPRPSEVAGVLDRAASFLEGHTWTPGKFTYDENGEPRSYCAITATYHVSKHSWDADSALAAELGVNMYAIPDWNDRQRDKRKVVRAMRRTARKIRNRQIVRRDGEWVKLK